MILSPSKGTIRTESKHLRGKSLRLGTQSSSLKQRKDGLVNLKRHFSTQMWEKVHQDMSWITLWRTYSQIKWKTNLLWIIKKTFRSPSKLFRNPQAEQLGVLLILLHTPRLPQTLLISQTLTFTEIWILTLGASIGDIIMSTMQNEQEYRIIST